MNTALKVVKRAQSLGTALEVIKRARDISAQRRTIPEKSASPVKAAAASEEPKYTLPEAAALLAKAAQAIVKAAAEKAVQTTKEVGTELKAAEYRIPPIEVNVPDPVDYDKLRQVVREEVGLVKGDGK